MQNTAQRSYDLPMIVEYFASHPAGNPYNYAEADERLICHWFSLVEKPHRGPFRTYGEALERARSLANSSP